MPKYIKYMFWGFMENMIQINSLLEVQFLEYCTPYYCKLYITPFFLIFQKVSLTYLQLYIYIYCIKKPCHIKVLPEVGQACPKHGRSRVNKHDLVKSHMYTTDGPNSHTADNAYIVNKEYTTRHINT